MKYHFDDAADYSVLSKPIDPPRTTRISMRELLRSFFMGHVYALLQSIQQEVQQMANSVKDILTKIDEVGATLVTEVEEVKNIVTQAGGDQGLVDEAVKRLDALKTSIENVSTEVQGGGAPTPNAGGGVAEGGTPEGGVADGGTTPFPEDAGFIDDEDDDL